MPPMSPEAFVSEWKSTTKCQPSLHGADGGAAAAWSHVESA